MAHIPGPWKCSVTEDHGGMYDIFCLDEDGKYEPMPLCDDMARVIAAAPDLLEAARYVLDHSLLYRVAGWEKLQAAVAKAEGAK